jgi:hypothetical protein
MTENVLVNKLLSEIISDDSDKFNVPSNITSENLIYIHNPSNVDPSTLPNIYSFNNGPVNTESGDVEGMAISEDGVVLGFHISSNESSLIGDMGVLPGSSSMKIAAYNKHYPNGYVLSFTKYEDVPSNKELLKALELSKKMNQS